MWKNVTEYGIIPLAIRKIGRNVYFSSTAQVIVHISYVVPSGGNVKRDVWIALFLLGLLLFGWPLLKIFTNRLPYYLFIVWFLFIGLLYLASRSSDRDDGGG